MLFPKSKLTSLILSIPVALAIIALMDAPAVASNGGLGILANDLPGPAPVIVLAVGWLMLLKRRR
jgi:hypothetical protein